MPSFSEKPQRAAIKSVTWKIIATLITLFTLYFFTREISISIKITIAEAVLGLVFFYIHERIWNRIGWGKTRDDK